MFQFVHRPQRQPSKATVSSTCSLLRRHGVAACLIGLLLLCAPAASHAAEKGIETDLTWGVTDADRDRTVAGVQDLGASWMRLTMSWHDIETAKGSYELLEDYDAAMEKAAASGTKILVTVYTAPTWASGVSDRESPPRDPNDYADFMRFAAQRWGAQVDAWEVWNEQNLWGFWSTGPDPAEYAHLLKTAYPAIKAADPTSTVLFGGVSYNDYRYIEGAYAAIPNLGDYYDVMATHPYSPDNPPEDVWYEADGSGRLNKKSFVAYREVRDVMLANGDDKPLWFTEFGWSTNSLPGWGVSEANQADYYTRAMRCIEQDPYVQVAIWYIYRNHAWASDANTWVDQLGLLRSDFSPKPAYNAFKAYTPGNTGCTYKYPEPTEPAAPADPGPLPTSELTPGMPDTIAGPGIAAAQEVPRLAVRRAQMTRGHVTIDGRVAQGATGRVTGMAVYGERLHRFSAPIGGDGRFRVRKPLPGAEDTSAAWIALIYRGDSRFQKQWVILQAAPRPSRFRLERAGRSSSLSLTRSGTVSGTVNPEAQGSVVLALFYRTRSGHARQRMTRARISDGAFSGTLRVPERARRPVVHAVFPGDPDRSIGGGSATLIAD